MFLCSFFFFFKQKTAYDMRISDWSSDVCSSDLTVTEELHAQGTTLDSGLKYVIGGYYERTKAQGISYANALFIEKVTIGYNQTKESYAPFIQGTYDLGRLFDSLSGLNLTAGARYTFDSDRKSVV